VEDAGRLFGGNMKIIAVAATLATLASVAHAQPAAPPTPASLPAYGAPITEAQAEKLVQAAVAEAKRLRFRMAVSIVEPTGALVMFHKIDDTQYASIRVSQEKATSAAVGKRATKAFADSIANSPGVATMGVIAIEGGLPIFSGGKIIGAIGVSGGSSAQDGQVAAAALAATGFSAP
jgi:glc operon protein GlcG